MAKIQPNLVKGTRGLFRSIESSNCREVDIKYLTHKNDNSWSVSFLYQT